jgi:GT2 family glycosyltransferase
VAHPWWGLEPDEPAYEDWPLIARNWSMVTGAVFATRKSILEEVNGFDESFVLEFNDLDLCLKIVCQGYRIVYTPHAHLVHYEKESRGQGDTPNHERHRFWHRWRGIIADDPMYHPRLSRDSFAIYPVADMVDPRS